MGKVEVLLFRKRKLCHSKHPSHETYRPTVMCEGCFESMPKTSLHKKHLLVDQSLNAPTLICVRDINAGIVQSKGTNMQHSTYKHTTSAGEANTLPSIQPCSFTISGRYRPSQAATWHNMPFDLASDHRRIARSLSPRLRMPGTRPWQRYA